MRGRRTCYPCVIGLLALILLLPGCSKSGRKVTQEDFNNIKKDMTQANVEALLGKSEAIPFDQAVGAVGMLGEQRNIYQGLSWQKWGSGNDVVLAGFSGDGKVRAKAFKVYSKQGLPMFAVEGLGTAMINGGKVEWKDE